MQLTDGKIDLYSGNDDQVVPILSLGGSGVISVLSNVAPRETHDMLQKFLDRDVAGSREIQLRALPLIDALFCEVNPIPVKAALNLMGKEVGPLRLPLTEMEPQNQERLAKAMKDFGIKLALVKNTRSKEGKRHWLKLLCMAATSILDRSSPAW